MAFPYIFQDNFEDGTSDAWDDDTDNDAILDFPNYQELARYGMQPHSGAYCARIVAPGATPDDAIVTANDCNIADTVTNYFRFNVYFADDFTCTATDICPLLELQGAANAVTIVCGFRITITTNVIQLGVGDATPDNWSARPIKRGVWYTVELCVNIETDGSGAVEMYVTEDGSIAGAAAEANEATLTNIAVTHAVFGLQDQLATTSGTILLDNFVQDNARLYVPNRYPETVSLTKTGHAFVGKGQIEQLELLPGSAAGSIHVYDSDRAETINLVATVLGPVASSSVTRVTPINVTHGAYCVLAGQGDPRALAKLKYAPHSAGAVQEVGRSR